MNPTESGRLCTLAVGTILPFFAFHEHQYLKQRCVMTWAVRGRYGVTIGSTVDVQK